MPNHLTRPMMGCRLRDCGAPDCPTCAGAEAARLYREQAACDHDEHDHGICIECGADITDALAGQAEDAADAAQDPMTLVEYCDANALPHWPIYSHLHRHGFCASTCTGLADIASPDHAACIARIKSLNPFHLGKIVAKGRTVKR